MNYFYKFFKRNRRKSLRAIFWAVAFPFIWKTDKIKKIRKRKLKTMAYSENYLKDIIEVN
jgi:hypothetical protein